MSESPRRKIKFAEKRAALDLWEAHIETLLANANGANVTLLKQRS